MAQTPAKKKAYPGHAVDYTASSNVSAGDVVEIGTIPMVADNPITNGALGALCCEGVYDLPKDASVFNAGDSVYWNASATDVGSNTGAATNSTGNLAGLAVAGANANASYVRTKLTAAKRTTTVAGSVTADDITGSDSSLAITGMAGSGAIAIAGAAGNANTAGGAVSLTGGAGGTGTSNGAAVAVAGGAAGAVGGTGGAITITSGAGDATNGTAGAITIDSGAGAIKGAIAIGTNASSITLGKQPRTPMTTVAAAGANLATAGALSEGKNVVTDADNAKGVVLPSCVNGAECVVINLNTDKTLKIYPPEGKQVNNAGANNAITVAANSVGIFWSEGTNAWYGLDAATDVA